MKHIFIYISLFLCLALMLIYAPMNAQETKTYKLSGFRGVEIGSAFEVHLKKSPHFSVSAQGDSEDLDELRFDIDKGVLEVTFKDVGRGWNFNFKNRHQKVVILIGMPELKEAEFTGAAKVMLSGFSNEEDIKLYFSGASKGIVEDLDVEKLSVELSGASKLKVSGKAVKLNIDASGASTFEGFPFIARDADVDLSGASRAEVTTKNSLHVVASGAAKVVYKGTPTISKDLSGAAVVKKED